jgi:RNase adaptor protein for sRNA GlmZ degradation
LPQVNFETDESLKHSLATLAKMVFDMKPASHWTQEHKKIISKFKSDMAKYIQAPPSCPEAQSFFNNLWSLLADEIEL